MLSQQVAHFNPTFPFPNLLLLSNILTRYSRSQDLNECHERTYQYRLAAAGSFCCPSPESYPPPSRLHLAINFLHFFGHPTFKHFKLWIVNLRSILNKLLSFCCFLKLFFFRYYTCCRNLVNDVSARNILNSLIAIFFAITGSRSQCRYFHFHQILLRRFHFTKF